MYPKDHYWLGSKRPAYNNDNTLLRHQPSQQQSKRKQKEYCHLANKEHTIQRERITDVAINMSQFRAITLSSLALLLLASNRNLFAEAQDDVDHTCYFQRDYRSTNKCQTIGNKICDDPNLGGSGGDDCLNQDCLDCNYHCKKHLEGGNEKQGNRIRFLPNLLLQTHTIILSFHKSKAVYSIATVVDVSMPEVVSIVPKMAHARTLLITYPPTRSNNAQNEKIISVL